jgi:maltose/moltooligosaccharide transporter
MHSSSNKPILSFWQLWNMSFGFFGIQFGFALQNANVSRIFSTLGANPDDLSLFWLAAPVTGLLVQPIIGYLSDNTWHPTWGRRRPFFFIGALLASIALFLMPNSTALWMAVIVLWLLDGAINVSMEPFRAFVGDKLGPSQQTAGFAMQTFFIGWGAVIASLLPTIFTTSASATCPSTARFLTPCAIPSTPVAPCTSGRAVDRADRERTPPDDLEAFRAEQRAKGMGHALREILGGFAKMPKTMVQLAAVQFFTWIALFAMWIYTTNAVGENVFGTTDAQSAAFQEAGNHVGVMFAVYGGVSALAAFILPVFARYTSRKVVHLTCLVIGGVSLFSIYAIHDLNTLFVPMIGVGIAWASILTMPYAILAGALPAKRMGYYMGVFNFFIVIPQIVSGLLLGL